MEKLKIQIKIIDFEMNPTNENGNLSEKDEEKGVEDQKGRKVAVGLERW